MKQFLKSWHRSLYLLSVAFFFAVFYPFLYYFSRKEERYKRLQFFRRFYALCSSCCVGFFYRYRMKERVDWSRTYIFCANHTSILDITAMTLLVENNFAFLGKEELLENPVTGLFFRTIDIPLNRESRISSFKAFKKAGEYLQKGISLVIFPEGKIGDDYPPVLHEFKNGTFRLAIENNIPIIPVSIVDGWQKIWDDGTKYGSKPGICHICVHGPVETSHLHLSDADALRDQVYSIIKSELA